MNLFIALLPIIWALFTIAVLYVVARRCKQETGRRIKAEMRLDYARQKIEMLHLHMADIVGWIDRYKHLAHWIQDDRDAAEDRVEKLVKEVGQLQVQLAGCGVAALGGTSPGQVATEGQYGWSPSYQDVLNLRRAYNDLKRYCEMSSASRG